MEVDVTELARNSCFVRIILLLLFWMRQNNAEKGTNPSVGDSSSAAILIKLILLMATVYLCSIERRRGEISFCHNIMQRVHLVDEKDRR